MDYFAPPTGIDPNTGSVTFGRDDNLLVFFHNVPTPNPLKSQANGGIPIFDTVVHCHIQQPGERDYADPPATDMHKQRFAKQWAAFEKGQEPIPEGTPIDMLFPRNPEIPPTLRAIGIHTIQQMASLSEAGIQRIPIGGRQWVESAKQYLGKAEGGAGFHKLSMELEKQRVAGEVKDQQIASLTAAVQQLEAKLQIMAPARPMPARATDFNNWQTNTDKSAHPAAVLAQQESMLNPQKGEQTFQKMRPEDFNEAPPIQQFEQPVAEPVAKRGPGRPRTKKPFGEGTA